MSAPWVVFIESNTTGTGRLFAHAARRAGLRPVILAADPGRYPYALEDGLDLRPINTSDEQAVLQTCSQLASEQPLAGVTSSSEYFIPMVAAISQHYGLPGPTPQSIEICRNKYLQRLRLQEAGVSIPAFFLATSAAEAVQGAGRLGYPVVVKPVSGSGSVGVLLCSEPAHVQAHAEALLAHTTNERGMPIPRQVLVEEFLEGPEYSVETFNTTVVGITQKLLGPVPHFVEIGHVFPAMLPESQRQAIAECVQHTLAAIGIGWGPSHIELRLTERGPSIIEINPRLAGGYIPELVRIATGIDLIDQTIRLVTSRPDQLQPQTAGAAAIRFLVADQDGLLDHISGAEAARTLPGVVEVRLYQPATNQIRRQGDFRDRLGHVIAWGSDAQAADQAATHGWQALKAHITPAAPN